MKISTAINRKSPDLEDGGAPTEEPANAGGKSDAVLQQQTVTAKEGAIDDSRAKPSSLTEADSRSHAALHVQTQTSHPPAETLPQQHGSNSVTVPSHALPHRAQSQAQAFLSTTEDDRSSHGEDNQGNTHENDHESKHQNENDDNDDSPEATATMPGRAKRKAPPATSLNTSTSTSAAPTENAAAESTSPVATAVPTAEATTEIDSAKPKPIKRSRRHRSKQPLGPDIATAQGIQDHTYIQVQWDLVKPANKRTKGASGKSKKVWWDAKLMPWDGTCTDDHIHIRQVEYTPKQDYNFPDVTYDSVLFLDAGSLLSVTNPRHQIKFKYRAKPKLSPDVKPAEVWIPEQDLDAWLSRAVLSSMREHFPRFVFLDDDEQMRIAGWMDTAKTRIKAALADSKRPVTDAELPILVMNALRDG